MELNVSRPSVRMGMPQTPLWLNRCAALGAIQLVRCARFPTAEITAEFLHQVFEPAFRHSQISIWTDDCDMPVGYVIWACLGENAVQSLVENPATTLHLSEWSEGSRVCIVDLAFSPGWTGALLSAVVELFDSQDEVFFLKRRGGLATISVVDKPSANRIIRALS